MNVIISGYGKMGSLIEERAAEKKHTIAAVLDPNISGASKNGAAIYKHIDDVPAAVLSQSVVIDFTHPFVVFDNIKTFAAKKLPIIVGTTGWYDKLDEVKKIVGANGTALLYAANFSLGVNLFYKIVGEAAALFDGFDSYDVGGVELHHNKKADSPSGTAKTLTEYILKNMKRKARVVYDKLDCPPEKDELHFASVRVGSVPGVHTVYFDSPADTIEITHTARSREGLVEGALIAAEWLSARFAEGGRGIFTLEDVLA